MPVEVKKEADFSMYPAEDCCICQTPTRFWFLPKDVALCGRCSEEVEAKDVPTKREWLVSQGANLPKTWKCHAERKRGRPRKVQNELQSA